jgi:UDP-glucuronate decarboxylase
MNAPDEITGPINIGNPVEFTILELAEQVIGLIGANSSIITQPLPIDDPLQRRPDITRASTLLGWQPYVPLEEGLRRTIEYFRGVIEEERSFDTNSKELRRQAEGFRAPLVGRVAT